MLLNEKRTTVAYRCPNCGGGIMSAVGLFNLSADMVKLKCTCGKSELKIVYNRDNTVRLTVPCLICAQPHTFTVNSSLFFSDELFVLPCPYSDERTPQDVVNYAFSRVGEGGYNIISNNCEHFANDCLFGKKKSNQVDSILSFVFGGK